jgi:transposase-like protein
MAKHRTHSIEFKRQVVQEFLGGESLHALARRHGIGRNLIKIWVAKFEAGGLDPTRRPPMCWPSMRRALQLSSVSLASSRLRTSF